MFTELEKYPQTKPEKRTLGFTAFPIPSYIRSEARHHDGFFFYWIYHNGNPIIKDTWSENFLGKQITNLV